MTRVLRRVGAAGLRARVLARTDRGALAGRLDVRGGCTIGTGPIIGPSSRRYASNASRTFLTVSAGGDRGRARRTRRTCPCGGALTGDADDVDVSA
jgi:hypothetical protein